MNALLHIDHVVFFAINGLQGHPAIDAFFLSATDLGSIWVALPLTVLALVLVFRDRAPRLLVPGLVLIPPLALLDFGLKRLFDRARPPIALYDAAHVLGPRLEHFSFPSGHALTAFAILGFFAVLDRRLAWIWLPCALVVDVSRIYLGAHFPSDVIAGSLLGFGASYGLCRVMHLEDML
jgi:undecaprenyl-diphosphatase